MKKINYFDLNKDLFLYKNSSLYFMDINTGNKLSNNLIILSNLNNEINFDKLYQSKFYINQYITGYYYPKNQILKSCKNKKINSNNQSIVYKKIKSNYSFIKYCKNNLESYNQLNTFYDIQEYYNLFNSVYNISNVSSKIKRISLLINLLNEIYELSSQYYNNIYFHVEVNNQLDESLENLSIENIIFYLYKHNQELLSLLSNIKFIFTNSNYNRFFLLNLNNINNKELFINKFKKCINILYKTNNGIELDESEKVLIDNSDEYIDNQENEIKKVIEPNSKKNSIDSKSIDLVDSNLINNIQSNNISKKEQSAFNVKKKINDKIGIDPNNLDTNDLILYDKINNKINTVTNSLSNNSTEKDIEDELNLDDEFLDDLNRLKNSNDSNQKSTDPRVEVLKKKQSDLVIKDKAGNKLTLNQILNKTDIQSIKYTDVNINTINKEVRHSTLKELDYNYNTYKKDDDMIKVISGFNNDPDCQIFLTKLERENTSDALTKQETLKITLEDSWGNKHNIKIDVPLILDNSFMYINGGKKSIGKQLTLVPIVKVAPDEVRITTNYKKLFITRFGNKVNPNIDKLKKFFKKESINYPDLKLLFGSSRGTNSKYTSTMDYDELSNAIIQLRLKKFYLDFNREHVNENIETRIGYDIADRFKTIADNKEFGVGCDTSTNSVYLINIVDGKVKEYDSSSLSLRKEYDTLFDLISLKFDNYDHNMYEILVNQKISKKYMYTRTRILGETIPLGILLGFYFGLENVMNRYNVKYVFEETRRNLSSEEKTKYSSIIFNDGILYYENNPNRNSVLLSGLLEINTKEYNFSDFNKEDVYLDYFELSYGSRNKSKGFKNILGCLLDPITIDVLKYLKMPDDLLGVLLYANTLLENNSYIEINDMVNYRLRSIEMINAHLYEIMAEAVIQYKDYHKSGRSDVRISIPQDKLKKKLLESPIIEEYSVLSPMLEIERLGSSNYKGIGGVNLDLNYKNTIC